VFVGVDRTTGEFELEKASRYFWRRGLPFSVEHHRRLLKSTRNSVLESQQSTELALHSLLGGRSLLSFEDIDQNLLVRKFRNPMLSILGAHLLLQDKLDPARHGLLRTVLRNLETLLPGSPDVAALTAMAALAGVPVTAPKPVLWPPMVRRGLIALREHDWTVPGTIVPGSPCDCVRSRLVSGGVWTRWAAHPDYSEVVAKKGPPRKKPAVKAAAQRPRADAFEFAAASKGRPAPAPKTAGPPAWQRIIELTGTLKPTAHGLVVFGTQLLKNGGRLRAEDLQWSGLSQQDAAQVAQWIRREAAARLPASAFKANPRRRKSGSAKSKPRAKKLRRG
jgi:hypothetical protein